MRAGRNTRQRILDAALVLFNERSPAQVTTAEIAEATGIAEGNLHYYFRKKADLLLALFEVFEAEAGSVAARDLGGDNPPLKAYVDYQRDWFRLMWTHRWLYRDTASLYSIAPEMRARAHALSSRAQRLVRSVFQQMIRSGVLRASADEAEHLLANVWIVSLYWIDYLRFTSGREALGQGDFAWGYKQVLALYSQLLTAQGKVLFQDALRTDVPATSAGVAKRQRLPGGRPRSSIRARGD